MALYNKKTVQLIIDNQYFLASNLENMNDLNEMKNYKNKNKFHILCFCNTNTEKIPMWYLYSGIKGDGVAIGFTPGVFNNWISKLEIYANNQLLIKDKDYHIYYDWIQYKKSNHSIKYRNKFYSYLHNKNDYFIKDYPWEYENEFRLVIENKTDITYDKLKVMLPNKIINKLKLLCAPETSLNTLKHSNILYSKLGIKMNLLSRNRDSIIESLNEIITKEELKKIIRTK